MRTYYVCRATFADTPEEKALIEQSRPHAKEIYAAFRQRIAQEGMVKSMRVWLWISLFVETARYLLLIPYAMYNEGGNVSVRTQVFFSLYWLVWSMTVVCLIISFGIRKNLEKYTDLITFMGDFYVLIYLARAVGLAAMEVETGIVGFSLITALFVSSFVVLHRPGIATCNILVTMGIFIATVFIMRLKPFYNPVVLFSIFAVAGLSLLISSMRYHARYKNFLKECSLIETSNKLNRLNEELEEKQKQIEMQNKKLQIMSTTDSLTGLHNRHSFVISGDKIFAKARENNQFVTLSLLDVDNFKSINDTCGHKAGDECLRAIGQVLLSLETEKIHAYRFGGDEFMLLFDGMSRSEAFLVMNRFSKQVSNITLERYDKMISVSVGIFSAIPNANETLDSFIEKADHAMYKAKEGGKNRIITSYNEGDQNHDETT